MTIDDELLLELIKPSSKGRVGNDALLVKILGKEPLSYNLEHSEEYPITTWTGNGNYTEMIKITPDIVVRLSASHISGEKGYLIPAEEIAFEVENDIHWDFQESLRQAKKYKKKYHDTRMIIPLTYSRFAPLFINEEFRVYLWSALRKWLCLRCGAETNKEGPVPPKCQNKLCNNSSSEFMLVGLEDVKIVEYPQNKL